MPELPPPLPHAERTVGQLVAETIRLYGDNFWRALPLGLPLAVSTQVGTGHGINTQIAVLCLFAPVFSAAFVDASVLVLDLSPPRSRIVLAWALGTLIWIPAPVLLRAYLIPSLAWLAFWGLAVPALLREGGGARRAMRRARRLATADYVHALGALCALLLVVELSAGVLSALLHGQGEATRRSAAFLALVVLSPMLYLGSALLYLDQAARVVGSDRSDWRERSDADLHPSLDADSTGRPDPQVEP
jgi:hypothetical protein